jgi:hypothetical protein
VQRPLAGRVVASVAFAVLGCAPREPVRQAPVVATVPPPPPAPHAAAAAPDGPLTIARAYARYVHGTRDDALADFRELGAAWDQKERGHGLPCKAPACSKGVTPYVCTRSGDGKWIGVVDDEGLVVLDGTTGTIVHYVPIEGFFQPLSPIPASPAVFMGGPDDSFALDLARGEIAVRWKDTSSPPLHAGSRGRLALVTGAYREDAAPVLRVWDSASRKEIAAETIAGGGGVSGLDWLREGTLLVGSGDRLWLWDVAEDGTLHMLEPLPPGPSIDPELSPKGGFLAYVTPKGEDWKKPNVTRLFDLSSRKIVASSTACPEAGGVAWSPDGTLLAVGDRLHACLLEVPSLRLRAKTPNLRGPMGPDDDLQHVSDLRFLGTKALLVRLSDPLTKLFRLPDMKVLWSGGAEEVLPKRNGGVAMKLVWDDDKAPGNVITIDDDLTIRKRTFVAGAADGAAWLPEAMDEPGAAAAVVASPHLCMIGRHVIPIELCGQDAGMDAGR